LQLRSSEGRVRFRVHARTSPTATSVQQERHAMHDIAVSAPASFIAASLPVVESARLMSGSREIVIQHAGQSYRLRVTRANKLILTK